MSKRYATIITDDDGREVVSAIGEFEGAAPVRNGWIEPVAADDDELTDVTGPRPSGRPKRAKKTLADGFLEAIRADFRAHGAGVIAEVRSEKPDQYLKIVLSVLPKDLHLNINSLEALSDDEIRQRIRGLEAVLRPFLEKSGVARPSLARQGLAKPGLAKPGRDGEDRVSEPAQGIGPEAAQ